MPDVPTQDELDWPDAIPQDVADDPDAVISGDQSPATP